MRDEWELPGLNLALKKFLSMKPAGWRVCLEDAHDLFQDRAIIEVNLSLMAYHYLAVGEGKEGVILADTHILPWKDLSAALAHKNRAYFRRAAVCELDPKILRIGIAPVFSCSC